MGHQTEASAELVSLIERRLAREVARHHVPFHEIADCVQDAWLALLKCHPEWRLDESRARAWLLTVARNKARNFYRERKRHPIQRLDDALMVLAHGRTEEAEGPAREGRCREGLAYIYNCLNAIPEANREILIQRVEHGLSFKAIGVALGLTSAQAKARFHRTVLSLRKFASPHTQESVKKRGGGRAVFKKSQFVGRSFSDGLPI